MASEHRAKRRKGQEEPMEVDDAPAISPHLLNGKNNQENIDFDHISDDEDGGIRLGDIYIPPPPKPALTFDANGPRLVIHHIRNINFKSYAGVQDLGVFHKSFTAIIGPNGSGKSNVIDSMLFVFGYRASKIRSKKVSVLIHSSSLHPNVDSATVEVHFCQIIDGEGESFTEVPGSQIVVSRSAFKDNSSYYQLNGRRVQFKEVAKMLRSYGIDLDHNRFLILQGEVEQIAMMKPKGQNEHDTGMLEYLEDIVGTNRYKEPIKKLEDAVEILNISRKEKLNRARAVEDDFTHSTEPMDAAVKLLNQTNSIVRTRNIVLQKYIHEGRKIVEKEEKSLNELTEARDKILEKLANIQKELTEKRAVLTKESEQFNNLKRQKEEYHESLQATKRKTAKVQADSTQANKKKKNLDQLLEQEKGKLIDMEMIPEKNTREIEDCEKLLTRHNDNKKLAEDELQTVMAGVRAKTQGLQEQKDRHQANLSDLQNIVLAENNKHKMAESELKIYLSTETKEIEKLESLNEAYTNAAKSLEEKQASHKQMFESIPSSERDLNGLQAKLQAVKTEEAALSKEARTLRAQLVQAREAMSANRSRGRVLDSLMTMKRKGHLPGIFGRLGDLGGIDGKYDVAISTCCGALDHIVVDTVETAQACVEYLKKNDIGRATFIALNKQEHLKSQYQKRSAFPESAPRLFDLIRVQDERVKPAFYYSLRDTLVARDLEQASRIAYGATRYRVVTLDGDVIEIAGTMSGGGKTQMRGRMSSSVQQKTGEEDPAALKANEERLAVLEQRLPELRNEQSRLEDAVMKLQRDLRDTKKAIDVINIDLKGLTTQVPHLKKQIEQQEKKVSKVKVDATQKARLEATLAETAEGLETAQKNAAEVESLVRGVDAQIAAVAGDRVKTLQNTVDDLTKKINKITAEVTKLKVAINTSKRNATKSKDKIKQMETDLAETEANIEKLKTTKKQLTLETSELQKKHDELEEQINEGGGQFSSIKEEIAKLQQKEDKRKGEKIAADNAVGKKEKSLQEYRAREPAWRRDLQDLKYEDPGVREVPEMEALTPLQTFTPEQLEDINLDELRQKLEAQKALLGDQRPNIKDILEYKRKEEIYMKRIQELEAITAERNRVRAFKDDIIKKRHTEFLAGFNTITAKLKEMYQMITLGGDAELELIDSMDPFLEGVTFSVRPPNKSWKNISNLSGGEKTLSSLALVFALHYYKPTPLYVMDEIDAALDFKNVSIVANYIKERTRNAQFIIISLRYNMFEASNRLIGIYKTRDCTKSVCIENAIPSDDEEDVEDGPAIDDTRTDGQTNGVEGMNNVGESGVCVEDTLAV